MCSAVTFQYKCGCAERVVFECPFPPTTSSNSSKTLHVHARRICPRRYRLHQQKLFPQQKQTATTTIPTSHDVSSPSMRINLPVLPLPKSYSPRPEKVEGKKANGCTVTEIDEICHDCWQHSLQLKKQRDGDGGASATAMGNSEEDKGTFVAARILREMPVNELILPPPGTSLGVLPSAESFFEG